MSYDLRLFRPSPGESLEASALAARTREYQSIADEPRPRAVEKDARNERLATSLRTAVPTLERLAFDYVAVGEVLDCSPDDARLRVRYHELDEPRFGMQVTLFDDAASVTLALENEAGVDQAGDAIRALWGVLEVFEKDGGFRAFDEPMNRVLDLAQDFSEVLARYRALVSAA